MDRCWSHAGRREGGRDEVTAGGHVRGRKRGFLEGHARERDGSFVWGEQTGVGVLGQWEKEEGRH